MSIDQIKNKCGYAWRARAVLSNGKRVSKCFERKIDAEKWEAKVKTEDLHSTELKKRQIRFKDVADQFLRYAKTENAVATYQKYESALRLYIGPRFNDSWIEEVSKTQVMDFKSELLTTNRSDSVKYSVFCILKVVLRKALEWDYIQRDPTLGVKSPKKGLTRTVYWNESEANQFLRMINTGHNPRSTLYAIALNSGMRLGEALGLKWDCVDLENGLITIRRVFDQKLQDIKETTKTHRLRVIGINHTLGVLLQNLKSISKSDLVIEREQIGCKDISHASRRFASDCRRANVRVIRFHDLRHTFATLFVRKGGSIKGLAGSLGHRSTTMTDRYAHFDSDHAKQIANVVNFPFELKMENQNLSGQKLVRIK